MYIYDHPGDNIVAKVQHRLLDILDPEDTNTTWAQGFISGLAAAQVITEREFDTLLAWLTDGGKV